MAALAWTILSLVLALILVLNLLAIASWRKLHPATFPFFFALGVGGNAFWLYLPLLLRNRLDSAGRVIRATLGPLWFAWLGLLLIYVCVMLLVLGVWLLSGRRRTFPEFGRPASTALVTLVAVISGVGFYQSIPGQASGSCHFGSE